MQGEEQAFRSSTRQRVLPSDDQDSDFDPGIIYHENTHGLSNRLVGGGSTIWTADELATAARWLAGGADHRLVLDGVYSFG